MFDKFFRIQQHESHGDIIVWPMRLLGTYLEATKDYSILEEMVPYTDINTSEYIEEYSVLHHLENEVNNIVASFIDDTSLSCYGGGDWDDTLQPKNHAQTKTMVSGWTVALLLDGLKTLLTQLEEQIDKRVLLESDINRLYDEIMEISRQITEINQLCKKKYATDSSGNLIFTENLLDELKEFIYQDTYSNDSITSDVDLLKIGKRKLAEVSIPTKSWSIDSVNFIEKLLDNEFRNQWQGRLGLGDMILLKGDNEVEAIYLVGYTQNFKDKTLELELSNKKANNEFSLSIGERLTQAKEAYENTMRNKYLLNSIRLKRLGVNYDKINREFL